MTTILLFLLGIIVGVVWTTGLVLLVMMIYVRKTAEVDQFIESQLQNQEATQFFEPVSAEEKIDHLFNVKQ